MTLTTLHYVRTLYEDHWEEGWPKVLDVGTGWLDALVVAHSMAVDVKPDFKVVQIKEKFATLRFYSDLPADVEAAIERLTDYVCEVCGAAGEYHAVRGWQTVLCDTHLKEGEG